MKLYLPTKYLVASLTDFVAWQGLFSIPPVAVLRTTSGEIITEETWSSLDVYDLANQLCCFCEIVTTKKHGMLYVFSTTFGKFIPHDNKWHWDEVAIITGTPMDSIRADNEKK